MLVNVPVAEGCGHGSLHDPQLAQLPLPSVNEVTITKADLPVEVDRPSSVPEASPQGLLHFESGMRGKVAIWDKKKTSRGMQLLA